MASGFNERIISEANAVLTVDRLRTSDEMLEMQVILRMEREFIEWRRQRYPAMDEAATQRVFDRVREMTQQEITRKATVAQSMQVIEDIGRNERQLQQPPAGAPPPPQPRPSAPIQ